MTAIVPAEDEERPAVHDAHVRAARRRLGGPRVELLPRAALKGEAAEVVEGRAATLAAEGVHGVPVHHGRVPAPGRGRRAVDPHLRPLRAAEVESEEVVEAARPVVAAEDIHEPVLRVHHRRGGRPRAGGCAGHAYRRPLAVREGEAVQVVEIVPPVTPTEDEHASAVHHRRVASARRRRAPRGEGHDAPRDVVEVEAVEVVEVPLGVVAPKHVHPLCMHNRRMGIAWARALPRHDKVELPRAGVEVEDEEVVPVHRAVVTAEDVERVTMHRGRRENPAAG